MNCLLVSATAAEIAPFLKHYRNTEKTIYIEFNLHILITGVGIMATSYHLTNYLSKHKPDIIIMVGIAGCFDINLDLGSVYAIKKDIVADMGVMEKNNWVDMFDLKMIKPNSFPYHQKNLENKNKELLKRTNLPIVNAVTVNQITTSTKANEWITKKYKPTLESMEGAALHYVALHHNIPFVQIRGVSNYIGVRNKTKWKVKEAINNSNQVLIYLLESL
jgi:futalosine hydrolase